MAIDVNQVKWDDSPKIDTAKVKWDAAPAVDAKAASAPKEDHSFGARFMSALKAHQEDKGGNAMLGVGETALNMATGIGASAIGGIRALGTLALGGSADDARRSTEATQQALTYQPRTGTGKLGTALVEAPFAALKAGGEYVGGGIGELVGGEKGRIAGESVGEIVPDIAGTLWMGRAGMKAAPKIQAKISAPLDRMRAATEKRAAEFAAEDAAALSGEVALTPAPAAPRGQPQSAGAAVSEQYRMAEAAGAAPEILTAIEQAGTNAHPVASARHAEASALPVPVELTPGQASGNAAMISFEKNNRGKYPELADKFSRQNEQIIANFDEVRQAVAPDIAARGVELGQMAVDAYKTMDDAVRADITAKYKALEDANGGNFPISAADFVTAAETALAKANRSRFLPAEVRGILDDVRESRVMTFGEFENYRTILAEQSRKAERSGDGTAGYAIKVVREALEDIPMEGALAPLKPLADAARSAARERFGKIESDPAYKAAVNDRPGAGEPSPLADKFIQNYVVNGKTANVQNLQRNLSGDPLNQQIIAAGVIDHLKHVSGIDLRTNIGNVTQKGLNSGIRALDKKAELLIGPEAASTIEALGNVTRYTMEQSKASFVNNSNSTVAAMADGAAKTVMHAIDGKTFGLAGGLRKMMEKRRLDRSVDRAMQPGAGINAADFPSLLAEMEAKSTLTQPPIVENPASNLASRVAAERARKLQRISGATTIDDAIRAASGEQP